MCGVAREGGILINHKGNIEDIYAWGLCRNTDNQVEAYGLFLRLSLTHKKGIMKIQVLGDSMLTVKHMKYNS